MSEPITPDPGGAPAGDQPTPAPEVVSERGTRVLKPADWQTQDVSFDVDGERVTVPRHGLRVNKTQESKYLVAALAHGIELTGEDA